MAKCYNCGNNFDYDKFYGICPKCSAYNREKLPEEEHQELHEQYDERTDCSNLKGEEHPDMSGPSYTQGYPDTSGASYTQGYQNMSGSSYAQGHQSTSGASYTQGYQNTSGPSYTQGYQNMPGPSYTQGYQNSASGFQFQGQNTYGHVQLDQRPKSSSGSAILFVFLILGIVAAIGTPIVYLIGRSMSLGAKMVQDMTDVTEDWNQGGFRFPEDDWASLDDYENEFPLPEVEQTRQNVEAVTRGIGENLEFGSGPMTIAVTDQAYVKIPSGQVGGFPEGENLVAIPVSYLDESTKYHTYNGVGMIYVRYGDQVYRSVLSPYDVGGYDVELDQANVLDAYEMDGEEGQGLLLVFVPEEITEISLYLEARDEDSYQMMELYEIPLEIRMEAPAEAQDGEVE